MKGVILVAGKGTRLAPITDAVPKCLLKVGGYELLHYQLCSFEHYGFGEVVLCAGFRVDLVEDFLARRKSRCKVSLEYNPFYSISNNIVSLWNVRHHLGGGFLLTNGDNLFSPELIGRLLACPHESALAVRRKEEYDGDDMKVVLDEAGRILSVNKDIKSSQASGESLGVMKFGCEDAQALINQMEFILRQPEGIKAYYLKAVEEVARSKCSIYALDVGAIPWLEIDYPDDYQTAKEISWQFSSCVEGVAEIVHTW